MTANTCQESMALIPNCYGVLFQDETPQLFTKNLQNIEEKKKRNRNRTDKGKEKRRAEQKKEENRKKQRKFERKTEFFIHMIDCTNVKFLYLYYNRIY